uniref:UPF0764 protein C16orf89 homolog isoform X1 n=1 Tax=Ciona intestinalis TaxID=7719 RepID=UPI00089DC462|nr:UPF0764 protein C16orf89 homolog isoform X1 [Ciona intestinalis]|eukprot:XP_018669224.1 UPF0764 protein C16orf89 homolog isoform X1 [Ciona intestinalis]
MWKWKNSFIPVFILLGLGFLGDCTSNQDRVTKRFTQTKNGKHIELSIDNVLLALEKSDSFFARNKESATVDLAFGMQMMNGELVRLLQLINNGLNYEFGKNKTLLIRIKNLQHSVNTHVQESLKHIKVLNERYYKNFEPVILEPWMPYQFSPQFTFVDEVNVITDMKPATVFNERDSDYCMSTLLGLNQYKKCSVELCWKTMTKIGQFGYYSTHQILWINLGQKIGCLDKMNILARGDGYRDVNEITKILCAGVVIEMNAEYQSGMTCLLEKDLFTEQGAVCGGIGFVDALHPMHLLSVLDWQDPVNGCYKVDVKCEPKSEPKMFSFLKDQKHVWNSRKLLEDSLIESKNVITNLINSYQLFTRVFISLEKCIT